MPHLRAWTENVSMSSYACLMIGYYVCILVEYFVVVVYLYSSSNTVAHGYVD